MRRVAVTSVLAALVAAATAIAARAACVPDVLITLTASGPDKPIVHVDPGGLVAWTRPGSAPASRIAFPTFGCSGALEWGADVIAWRGCSFGYPGTYPYTVEGFGAGSGAVVVNGTPPAPQHRTVVYGSGIVLSGAYGIAISRAPPSFGPPPPVDLPLFARPYGAAAFSQIATVRSFAPPPFAWTYTVRPTLETTYAIATQTNPEPFVVFVRPRLTLTRRHRAVFRATAAVEYSLAGRSVAVEVRKRRRWRLAGTVTLAAGSSTVFRAPARDGATIRLHMAASEAGPGYVDGYSAARVVRSR